MARLGSNAPFHASPMPASDGLWYLGGIQDHAGGPAHSASIKPTSDVALALLAFNPFFVRSGAPLATEKN